MNIVYIIIGIIVFGILIAVHELGHFLAAKAFGVKVLEFSIGMGPRILKKQGRETLYSLKALPLGGSCLMEGEDEDSPDPRSFTVQRRWKRLIILAAGAFMNFVVGAIVVFILVSQMNSGFVGHHRDKAGGRLPGGALRRSGPDDGRQARLCKRRAPVLYR